VGLFTSRVFDADGRMYGVMPKEDVLLRKELGWGGEVRDGGDELLLVRYMESSWTCPSEALPPGNPRV
jgi:hypothetical protein